jgi:hypothetical protein
MMRMLLDSFDLGSGVNNPVQDIYLNQVKWRITRRLLLMHTKLIALGAEGKGKLGGSEMARA